MLCETKFDTVYYWLVIVKKSGWCVKSSSQSKKFGKKISDFLYEYIIYVKLNWAFFGKIIVL